MASTGGLSVATSGDLETGSHYTDSTTAGDAVWRAVEPPLDALEGGAERRLPARHDALFSPAEAAP